MAKYIDQILEPLRQLESELNGKLKHSETTWFNAKAYFPYHIITLENNKSLLTYEYRVSDFSKSNFMDPSDNKDRHNLSFEGISDSETKPLKAKLRTNLSFFGKKRNPVYKITCKDKKFAHYLKSLPILKEFYDNTLTSSEFEPVIYIKYKKGQSLVSIYYMLPKFEIGIVRQTFEVYEAIMKYCETGGENVT